jgi:hypothetical protein
LRVRPKRRRIRNAWDQWAATVYSRSSPSSELPR